MKRTILHRDCSFIFLPSLKFKMENGRVVGIEVKWADKLFKLTEARIRLLERIREHLPYQVFEHNVFFHSSSHLLASLLLLQFLGSCVS
jgi:hypothetical protein